MKTPAEQMAANKAKRQASMNCKLGEFRNALGLSLRDVASAVGLTAQAIVKIEQGNDVLLSSAKKISVFFGKNIEDIWPNEST